MPSDPSCQRRHPLRGESISGHRPTAMRCHIRRRDRPRPYGIPRTPCRPRAAGLQKKTLDGSLRSGPVRPEAHLSGGLTQRNCLVLITDKTWLQNDYWNSALICRSNLSCNWNDDVRMNTAFATLPLPDACELERMPSEFAGLLETGCSITRARSAARSHEVCTRPKAS